MRETFEKKDLENRPKPIIALLDGNALMHRAYHGIGKGFIPIWNGQPVGMVYGFASSLLNIIKFLHPDVLIVTFDTKEKTFRHKLDPEYKAHREKTPDDFYEQIPLVDELLESFELSSLKKPGFESDDLIGTLARHGEAKDFDVRIISGDLDFLQLVSDDIKLIKLDGKIEQSIQYGPAETHARYGISPEQMIDFKSIVGDSSDNYRGIPGVGPKTAEKLLQHYGTLDEIYSHLSEIEPLKLREKFETSREYVAHCKTLATICTDVLIELPLDKKFTFTPERTLAFFEKMKFQSLAARYQKLIKNYDQVKSSEQKSNSEKSSSDAQLSLFSTK